MGVPGKRIPFVPVRIKGKPREVDLRKSGIGTCRVKIEVTGNRGNQEVIITQVPDSELDNPTVGESNSG